MYCKVCGHKNEGTALYCSHDGVALGGESGKIRFSEGLAGFCNGCGEKNQSSHIYCSSCGKSLRKAHAEQDNRETITKGVTKISTIKKPDITNVAKGINGSAIRAVIPGAALAAGIVLVLSFIIGSVLTEGINQVLYESLRYDRDLAFIIQEMNPISAAGILMYANLVASKLAMSVEWFAGPAISGTLSMKAGLYILLLVPLIGLISGGYVNRKKQGDISSTEKLVLSITTGVLYAAFLILISFFAKNSLNMPAEGLKVSFGYSFLGSIFSGLFLGSLFSYIGMELAEKKASKEASQIQESRLGKSLFLGMETVLLGLALSIVFVFVLLLIEEGGSILDEPVLLMVLLPQIGAYFFNMANLGSLSMSSSVMSYESYKISLFGESEAMGGFVPMMGEVGILRFAILLIPLILLVKAGKKMTSDSAEEGLKPILLFSAVYAGFMSILAHLTNLNVSGSGQVFSSAHMGNVSFFVGFSPVPLFLTAFLMAVGLSFVGNKYL